MKTLLADTIESLEGWGSDAPDDQGDEVKEAIAFSSDVIRAAKGLPDDADIVLDAIPASARPATGDTLAQVAAEARHALSVLASKGLPPALRDKLESRMALYALLLREGKAERRPRVIRAPLAENDFFPDGTSLGEMAVHFHTTSACKGWWDPNTLPLRSAIVPHKLFLVSSEIAEALEEIRNGRGLETIYLSPQKDSDGRWTEDTYVVRLIDVTHACAPIPKPEGVPVELADAFIRVCDLAVYFESALVLGPKGDAPWESLIPSSTPPALFPMNEHDPIDVLERINAACSSAASAWRKGLAIDIFEMPLLAILNFVRLFHLEAAFATALAMKARYNLTRPARHGGKVL